MKRRRIKFVWGASKVIQAEWRLGLFGLYDRKEGKHDDGLAISVRGALAWLGGAAVVGYVALATALFWFWQKNPYSLLTYRHALFRPFLGAEVRDLQGQAFIAQGIDSLRAKRYAEAVGLLRQGLANHPNDLKARLTLAQFYVAANQRPMALRVLQEGLSTEYPGRIYLQGLFDVAEQGDDHGLVVQLSERFLPQLQGDAHAVDRRWVVARQFSALMAAGRFADALAIAQAEPPGDGASEHRVIALLASGRQREALAALAEWEARPGADTRAVMRLRVRTLREAKQFDEMEATLEKLRVASPADPRPLVFGIVQRVMGGRAEAARRAFDDFVFRFGGTTQNLQLVAEPLAEIAELALLERCAAAAAERGYPAEPYQVLLVQTYVQKGDWPAATRTLAAMKPPATTGRNAPLTLAWRDWMHRVIEAAATTGDTAGPALVEFLRQRPWPMKIFRKSIEAARLANRLETARDVAALAAAAFPASAWVETQREEIAAALAAEEAAKAAQAAPLVARAPGLPEEKIYFQRMDDLLSGEQWALAEQFLRDARNAKPMPGWLASRVGDLRFVQVRIAHGRGDLSELLAASKLYLNGDAERCRRVIEIARAVHQRGERDMAIALARETVRALPDYPPGVRLLKEWQQKPAATAVEKAPAKQ